MPRPRQVLGPYQLKLLYDSIDKPGHIIREDNVQLKSLFEYGLVSSEYYPGKLPEYGKQYCRVWATVAGRLTWYQRLDRDMYPRAIEACQWLLGNPGATRWRPGLERFNPIKLSAERYRLEFEILRTMKVVDLDREYVNFRRAGVEYLKYKRIILEDEIESPPPF